jgi:DNA-binding MarR family transcriptional regulator
MDAGKPTAEAPLTDYEAALKSDDKLELRLWLRLLTCANLIETEVRRRLRRDFDTTLPRFDVLAQLQRNPDGLTMGELSRRMMVSNGNITGLIDRLVAEGLVRRASRPEDRRTVRVSLTAKGRRSFGRMTPRHESWIDDLLAGMDRQDKTRLYELLGSLKDSTTEAQREDRA